MLGLGANTFPTATQILRHDMLDSHFAHRKRVVAPSIDHRCSHPRQITSLKRDH